MSDPIANMIVQISNANKKFKETVELPSSKMKLEVARVLKEEGFIGHYRSAHEHHRGTLRLTLKYTPQKERVIQGLKRISKPGLRVYRGWQEIPIIQNGLGIAILSTFFV